ncbi:MAG: hypothetical protein OXR72_04540 [Gemmatimonadota bacterium]|nr:hypothetical protein [Gemmatimonadota bacterium]
MSTIRYVVLAIATLAIGAGAIESKTPEAERSERDAWEIAWSAALYKHRAARSDRSAFPWDRDRSDAREIYGDAWVIYRDARAIYEADREGKVVAAWEELPVRPADI